MKQNTAAALAVSTIILLAPLAHSQNAVATAPKSTFTAAVAKNFDASLDVQLIAAIKNKNTRKVADLLARNANPNAHDTDTRVTTALGVAAPLGNLEIVKMLVEAGADVENGNVPGQSPLVLAAAENQGEIISYLLQRGAKPDSNKYEGLTALMVAASMGNSKTTRMLLDAGANVNARTTANGTALIFGSCKTDDSRGSLEVVKMLVAAGADLFVKTKGGKDALKMARDDKLTDIADYLYAASKTQIDIDNLAIDLYNAGSQAAGLSKNPSPTPWSDAQKLLDKGAKGNFVNKTGETALILFSLDTKGFVEATAKRLIAVSDINAQAKKGASALQAAAQSGNERMVALLIASGAHLSPVTSKGNTPLDSASKYPAIAAMLRNAGAKSSDDIDDALMWGLLGSGSDKKADSSTTTQTKSETSETPKQNTPPPAVNSIPKGPLDKLDDAQHTPLMLAALHGDATKVAQLLKDGATVDIANNMGNTALFSAAFGDNPASIKLLLDAGADINHLNESREHVIVACAFKGSLSVMRTLFDAGADRKYLQNALLQAKDGENKPVLDYLTGIKDGLSSQEAAKKAIDNEMKDVQMIM